MMGLFTKGRPCRPSSVDDKAPEDTNYTGWHIEPKGVKKPYNPVWASSDAAITIRMARKGFTSQSKVHGYPPSTTLHLQTRLPSSVNSSQGPTSSATQSRR
ncbi:hypothetical protein BC826DRAFT_184832 [Russula brevipes]|nr:hypothetical protein BC826DRAFT_184832 [Russula brevipes]